MNVENMLKRTDINRRGYFALVHKDSGKIYSSVAENIHKELSSLIDELKSNKCMNSRLQRLYNASPEFDVLIQISSDGMRGAKKDHLNFRSCVSARLFVNELHARKR